MYVEMRWSRQGWVLLGEGVGDPQQQRGNNLGENEGVCVVSSLLFLPSETNMPIAHCSLCFPVNCSFWTNSKRRRFMYPKGHRQSRAQEQRQLQGTSGYASPNLEYLVGLHIPLVVLPKCCFSQMNL